VVFDNVETQVWRGEAHDMEGYPKLWFDFAPPTHRMDAPEPQWIGEDLTGWSQGYVSNQQPQCSFQDLLLLRSAEWTVDVSIARFLHATTSDPHRKQQYHDNIYDSAAAANTS